MSITNTINSIAIGLVLGCSAAFAWSACPQCGVVQGVNITETKGDSSGVTGAVAGGLLGGVLGNQVGKGGTRDLATVAVAVGGAYLGNRVEKKMDVKTVYEMSVKMEDGSIRKVVSEKAPVFRAGDNVKLVNDQWQPN